MRTSTSHPLQIAAIEPAEEHGLVGLTFCPGKVQQGAMTGSWNRDLGMDLDAICAWNASVVVTLVEEHELAQLQVPQLGSEVLARHMDWYHLPIADRSIPDAAFEDAWKSAGPALRQRLRSGANVLVHCMGGLGRAGTIASRLLVELGWNPAEAVGQVRQVRPGAIETQGQTDYVLSLEDVPLAAPDTSLDAIRTRAMGAMLGLAVGDALGTTLEFHPRDSYPRLMDMVGGGPFGLEPGVWTDDTSMALALAESLADCGGLDEADLMQRLVRWHELGEYSPTGSCFDIGITVRQALARFKASGNPQSGSTDPLSAGNGSLMRLAPVAIRYWNDRAALRDAAARQSRTTHGAVEAVDACVAYAELLADAIAGKPASEVLQARSDDLAGNIASILAGSWRGKHRDTIRASGYVAHSLEASLWSISRSGTYAEAVLTAANLGEDADTTAAITGQLAGALHGVGAIPPDWLDRLAWRDRLEAAATRLFEASIE
ncbi:crystallin [Erythrobacter sp. SG61-1L]|uniref:ADP-ribosylglycohydrolase family protein n=1 Tax=Erythrobacter sp. SG61-1L TaxID=1603897 RepID=UPI0006C8EA77|nr:ADP-ribosylglycohydrolase family protein [Erythrobacter sp. SG61-1L]KPL68502.1 crystallin [Erythrobacter sp. SG61-1L]